MPELPHPRDHVDQSWEASERDQAILYLEQSYLLTLISLGWSWCRLVAMIRQKWDMASVRTVCGDSQKASCIMCGIMRKSRHLIF